MRREESPLFWSGGAHNLDLTAAGVVEGSTGWTLAKSYMPLSPDKVIGLFETGGTAPLTQIDADNPAFQVRVRGLPYGYQEARDKLTEIQNALHTAQGVFTGAYTCGTGKGPGYRSW